MAELDVNERPTEMKLAVLIPHRESNFYVELPENLPKWAEGLMHDATEDGYVRMTVDNMPSGCGGVGISFAPMDDARNKFLLIVTKETLARMIAALQLAHDNYID